MTATFSPAVVSTGVGGTARATGILRKYSPADDGEGSDCPLPRGDHSTGPIQSNILAPKSSFSCKKLEGAKSMWAGGGVCGSDNDGGGKGTVETGSCTTLTGLATGEATGAKFTAAVRASFNSLAELKRSSERFCMAFARTALTASEMYGANMRTGGGCWRTCLSNTSTGV